MALLIPLQIRSPRDAELRNHRTNELIDTYTQKNNIDNEGEESAVCRSTGATEGVPQVES